jgi:hypothetical protein
MADSKTELENLTKNLGKFNRTVVENAEKLGTEAQKTIAKQIGEQKKDFSSFLAGRKLQKAIRNTDTTALEQAKKNLDMTKLAQESAVEADEALIQMKEEAYKNELKLQDEKSMSMEDQIELEKKQSTLKKEIDDKETEIRNKFNTQLQDNTEQFDKLTKEYNETIENAGKSDGFDKFAGGLKTLTNGLVDIAPIFDDIIKYANAIKDVTTGVIEFTANLGETLMLFKLLKIDSFATFFTKLKGVLSSILLPFKFIGKFIGKKIILPIIKVIGHVAYSLFDMFMIMYGGLVKVVTKVITGIPKLLMTLFKGLVKVAAKVGGIFITGITKIFRTIGTLWKGLLTVATKVGVMLQTVFVTIGTLFKQFILIPIRAAVVALATAIASAFTAAVATIGAIPLAIAAVVIGLVLLAFIFKDYIAEKWGEFKLKFTEFMEALKLKASEIKTFVSEKWTEYVITPIENFMMKIKNLLSLVSEKIEGFKTSIGIVDEDTRTQLDSARESGLYDEDYVGKSEIDKSKIGDATTQQLEAIVKDNDLREDDMKLVQDELAMRKQQELIDSTGITPIPNTTGDELAEGTVDVANAAQQIVASVNTVQQNQNNVSNNTTIARSNPTTGNSDPSAGTGNGMGWGSFAGQGGYGN